MTVSLTFTAASTNASVTTSICSNLNASVTTLMIQNSAQTSAYFQFPSCLGTSSVTYLDAEYMTTSSFAVFPTTLTNLYCRYCQLRYDSTDASTPISLEPAARTMDGFNTDGSIAWSEIFTTYPSLIAMDFFFGGLTATLPAQLPANFNFFRLRGINYNADPTSGLTGTFPAGLLSLIGAAGTATSTFYMDISFNRVTGTIPSNFFSGFSGKRFKTLQIDAYGMQLSGTIPPVLFSPLGSALMTTFSLNLASHSNLGGSIPSGLFVSGMIASAGGSVNVNFGSCALNGSIPDGIIATLPGNTAVYLDLSYNQLIGPLPSYLYTTGDDPSLISLNWRNNNLNGSLTNFLSASLTSNKTIPTFFVDLQYNQLTGTIPESLLLNYYTAKRDSDGDGTGQSQDDSGKSFFSRSSSATDASDAAAALAPSGFLADQQFTLSLAHNQLTGTVPPLLLSASFNPASALPIGVSLDLSYNKLNDTVPSDLFAGVSSSLTGIFTVVLSGNQFTGTVPTFCRTAGMLTLLMDSNNLTGTIPTEWQSCRVNQVDVSNNPNLIGSIPHALLNGTGIYGFAAKNTSLSGTLPPIASALTILELSLTKIDFCNADSIASFTGYSQTCRLESSEACYCASSYTKCGSTIACPPPGFLPVAPSAPTAVPINPPVSAPTTPPPTGCLASAQPGPEFTCINGRWTATTITSPALVIPPGAGKVIVNGDVESDEVVLRDLSSSIEISGCANNLANVNLQLTKQESEQVGGESTTQTLITTSGSGCNSLGSVNLNTQVSNQGCKKLKSAKQVSPDGSTLNAVFSLQTSSCNTWWIILVSVICGVIVIGVIIIVVSVVCCTRCKRKVRPFAGSDGRHSI